MHVVVFLVELDLAGLDVAGLDVAGLGVVVVVVEVVRNWASVAVVAAAYQRGTPPLHC